jgi:hypothetical protein
VAYGEALLSTSDRKQILSVQLIERRSAVPAIAAWTWVIAMTLAYLAQFVGYIRPILSLFG